ncbi:MAG: hypothetical protein G01um101438_783 [Parcubacteria group bacterium Gr01-1014_38]|nr:MAG: hypothetical protein G01um101438_783 [Parcubacteria group bacterium Gr01-1014_38]
MQKFLATTDVCMELWGITDETYNHYRERCRAVGTKLRQEVGLTPKEIGKIPLDAELPRGAATLFAELEEWWKSRMT